jgi:lipoprotein-anchoring transpeptidase ErfK/SrfK
MRRSLIVLAVALVVAPAAAAAPPVVTVTETGLTVRLRADAPVQWDFGDGAVADGQRAVHTYAKPGGYTVTATNPDGETALVDVTARTVRLQRPQVAAYGERVVFHGAVVPPGPKRVTLLRATQVLGSVRPRPDGTFSISARVALPGGYRAAVAGIRSNPVAVVVRPLLTASLARSTTVDGVLQLRAALHPAGGRLAVTVFRDGKPVRRQTFGPAALLRLDTSRPASLRLRLTAIAFPGYAPVTKDVSAVVVERTLAVGAAGSSVARLTAALAALHYVVPRTASFSDEVLDALYAFQKVQGLPRTGVADASTWAALERPRLPQPRYATPADHLEVDKVHQVLYVVRGGEVSGIVPVSTAGLPGKFTPVGTFSIYRKVNGFDPSPLGVLYDPMYFTGGYAIHGNPSVPPYPASHGCVRVPMWIIPSLYETNGYGETVYVY